MDSLSSFFRNKFIKVYSALFIILNTIYVYLFISKSIYVEKYNLNGIVEAHHYEYLSSISKITNLIETVFLLIFSISIFIFFKSKEKVNLNNFLFLNFIFFITSIAIYYLISKFYPITFFQLFIFIYIPSSIMIVTIAALSINLIYKNRNGY